MITIIKAPVLNRVLLDSNNTEITIRSSNGSGYYFRALIYVDNVLFDEQGWSRLDNHTAIKDIKKLYNAYFESEFSAFNQNGLTEENILRKKIKITIQEISLSTDLVIETIDLPEFYILYNSNPEYFDDSTKIQILGITPPVLRIPVNGKVVIPFYVKASDESVEVQVTDNFGNILDTQHFATFSDKKILKYSFDFAPLNLVKDTIYFEAKITCGLISVNKMFRLIQFPDFKVKEIYFKNNFGYYIPAYFDGELEIQNNFKPEDYQQADGTNAIFEINQDNAYTINTGSLLQDERAIVNQISSSHEIIIKINNQWRQIQTATKKVLEYKDKKHIYAQDLAFTFVKNGKVSNYYDTIGADWDDRDFLPKDWLT